MIDQLRRAGIENETRADPLAALEPEDEGGIVADAVDCLRIDKETGPGLVEVDLAGDPKPTVASACARPTDGNAQSRRRSRFERAKRQDLNVQEDGGAALLGHVFERSQLPWRDGFSDSQSATPRIHFPQTASGASNYHDESHEFI